MHRVSKRCLCSKSRKWHRNARFCGNAPAKLEHAVFFLIAKFDRIKWSIFWMAIMHFRCLFTCYGNTVLLNPALLLKMQSITLIQQFCSSVSGYLPCLFKGVKQIFEFTHLDEAEYILHYRGEISIPVTYVRSRSKPSFWYRVLLTCDFADTCNAWGITLPILFE